MIRNLYRYVDIQRSIFIEQQQIDSYVKEVEQLITEYYFLSWFINGAFYPSIEDAISANRSKLDNVEFPVTINFYLENNWACIEKSELNYCPSLKLMRLKGYKKETKNIESDIKSYLTNFFQFYHLSVPIDELEQAKSQHTCFTITAPIPLLIAAYYQELQRLEYLRPIIEEYIIEFGYTRPLILPNDDKFQIKIDRFLKLFSPK